MSQKSMLESAYQILSKGKKMSFASLWKKVCSDLGLSEEDAKNKVSRFYTLLTLDGRFVFLQGNYWDLAERLKYEDVHVSVADYYADEGDAEEDEDEEDKAYKKLLTGDEAQPAEEAAPAGEEEENAAPAEGEEQANQ